jgi:hypothetical protein
MLTSNPSLTPLPSRYSKKQLAFRIALLYSGSQAGNAFVRPLYLSLSLSFSLPLHPDQPG